MNVYKIRLKPEDLMKFINFCLVYHISVVVSYSIEEFWGNCIYCFVTDIESNGITFEEKQRLIKESGFNIVNNQKLEI